MTSDVKFCHRPSGSNMGGQSLYLRYRAGTAVALNATSRHYSCNRAAPPATVQAAVVVKELVGARAGMRPALLVALCGAWCAAAAVAELQVCRVGLEKAVRASVPLHAGDWVDWGRICVSPGGKELKGWCLDAPAHKGRAGYEDAVCGKDACWAVTRDAFSPSEKRRTARPVVASGTRVGESTRALYMAPDLMEVTAWVDMQHKVDYVWGCVKANDIATAKPAECEDAGRGDDFPSQCACPVVSRCAPFPLLAADSAHSRCFVFPLLLRFPAASALSRCLR